jgi:cytochrome b
MVRVWDGPTRAFHWLLALLVVGAWASFEYSERLKDHTLVMHRLSGYAILILVTFRLIWGIVGSSTVQFRTFVRGPLAAMGYGLDLLRGREPHFLGHNPLGAFMILALLAVLAIQALLGLFNSQLDDGTVSGPLSSVWPDPWLRSIRIWHRQIFNYVLLPLVAVHVTVNILYVLLKREPLIKAMITGRKPRGDYADGIEASIDGNVWRRALVCLLLAAAIVLVPLKIFGGDLI